MAKLEFELAENDYDLTMFFIDNVDDAGHNFGFSPTIQEYLD